METKMSRESKLIKGMAKRARDFFQFLADTMKGYVEEEDVKEPMQTVSKKSKSSSKKAKKKGSELVYNKRQKKAGSTKKVEKDPNAPKKPLPAFLLFSNSKRRLMKEGGVSKKLYVGL